MENIIMNIDLYQNTVDMVLLPDTAQNTNPPKDMGMVMNHINILQKSMVDIMDTDTRNITKSMVDMKNPIIANMEDHQVDILMEENTIKEDMKKDIMKENMDTVNIHLIPNITENLKEDTKDLIREDTVTAI